jgi:tetratricopeptide (TPR) repeat protein
MISQEEYKILKSFAQRIPENDPGAHNNLAVVYFNKGLYDEALSELEKALVIDPDFVLARNNMEIILQKSGRLEDKVQELSRAIDAQPFDEHATIELADTYRKLNRYSQSIIFYRKVLDYNPGSFEAHFGLGSTLRSLGKYDDALEEIKKALEVKITPDGYRLLGELYFNKGIIDLAIKNFQESLMLDPASAEGHFFLGFALGEKGKIKEGLEEVRKAIAINPSLAQFEPNLPIQLKDHKGHLEFLKEQLGIPKVSVNEFQARFNLGMTFLNKGLFDEARREFEDCLKVNNRNPELLGALGELNLLTGRVDEARKYLEPSLELDYASPRLANDLGIAYLLKNDFGRATNWFKKALGLQKDFSAAINNLAVTQHCDNKVDEALKNFDAAARFGNHEARFNLGFHYFKLRDFETALKHFNGDTVEDIFGRGLVLAESGRDDDALAAFKTALNLAPNHAGSYYNIGFIYMKLGKFEDGLNYIRKGMEIEPNFEKEKYRLAIGQEFFAFGPYYIPNVTPPEVPPAAAVEDFKTVLEVPQAEDYLEEAEAALRKKNFEKAVQFADEAIKLKPFLNKAVILKAKIYYQSGFIEQSLEVLENFTREHPDDTEALVVLGRVYKSVGNLELAKDSYEKLVGLETGNLEWLSELAEIHYALDDLESARKIYGRMYELSEQNVAANLGLLKIYIRQKAYDQAQQYLAALEKNHPDIHEFNVYAGIYWFENNDRQKAERYFQRAIELDPSKPLPYYHMGLLLVQKGNFDEACDNWKKALLMSPEEDLAEKISHCLKITMEMLEFLKKGA